MPDQGCLPRRFGQLSSLFDVRSRFGCRAGTLSATDKAAPLPVPEHGEEHEPRRPKISGLATRKPRSRRQTSEQPGRWLSPSRAPSARRRRRGLTSQQKAAIDAQSVPGDEARVLRCQKERSSSDVDRLTEALQRRLLGPNIRDMRIRKGLVG